MKKLENCNYPQTPDKLKRNTNGKSDSGQNEEIVIGHCLLDPLARVKGIKPASPIDVKGANVIQLPCPEAMFFGMRRREITKDQLDHPAYRRFCREIFTPYQICLKILQQTG